VVINHEKGVSVINVLVYRWIYIPIVTIASFLHHWPYIVLVRLGAWLRRDVNGYMIDRVVNHIEQIESKRKEDNMQTNTAIVVGTVRFIPITDYMLSPACTEEQRESCLQVISTGDFGPANNAGLNVLWRGDRFYVRPISDTPLVVRGELVSV
jgi:hypothetical protein